MKDTNNNNFCSNKKKVERKLCTELVFVLMVFCSICVNLSIYVFFVFADSKTNKQKHTRKMREIKKKLNRKGHALDCGSTTRVVRNILYRPVR